jgi:hypothetical protein
MIGRTQAYSFWIRLLAPYFNFFFFSFFFWIPFYEYAPNLHVSAKSPRRLPTPCSFLFVSAIFFFPLWIFYGFAMRAGSYVILARIR